MGTWFTGLHPIVAFLVNAFLWALGIAILCGVGYGIGQVAGRVHHWWKMDIRKEQESQVYRTKRLARRWWASWSRAVSFSLLALVICLVLTEHQDWAIEHGLGGSSVLAWIAGVLLVVSCMRVGWTKEVFKSLPLVEWAIFGLTATLGAISSVSLGRLTEGPSEDDLGPLTVVLIDCAIAGVWTYVLWRVLCNRFPSPVAEMTSSQMASDGELESLGLDALGRASIAKRLASLILHQDPPFTLGIDGEWGSGKSTLMNFVDDQLWYETTGVNPESRAPASRRLGWAGGRPGRRMVLVRLNLWEHQHDENPVVALLQAARDTLPPAYRAGVSAEIEGILAACASAVALGVGDILVGTSLPTAVGIRDKLGSAIAGRDGPFSTQETQATLVSMFQDAVETVLEVHAADRIVFVVDDLDRCMPDVALDLLEKVHLFFRQVRCIFVLGVDTDILKLTVTKRYTDEGAGERASDYAEKYVEKIITFPYALPPVTDLERRIYLSRLLNSLRQTDAQEGLSGLKIAEILETWTAGLGENAESLRRTKRLANTFILHQRIQNPESDATKLADGDRVAPPPHAGGVLGTTPASSEDQAVADDTQSRTHMTLVYHGGVNHEVTAPSSILYPATKDFDPWILAAVTAIQILAPRDFKELAGPTGDTAIERWFFPKEKS